LLHWADPSGTLPTPWNAGFVGIGWITEDFTKNEVQQRQRTGVLDIQKVPLQGFWEMTRPLGGGFPVPRPVSPAGLSWQFFTTLRLIQYDLTLVLFYFRSSTNWVPPALRFTLKALMLTMDWIVGIDFGHESRGRTSEAV